MSATPVGAKATTPTPASREQARVNSGKVSHQRAQAGTPTVDWVAALARLDAMLAERDADEAEPPPGSRDTGQGVNVAPSAAPEPGMGTSE